MWFTSKADKILLYATQSQSQKYFDIDRLSHRYDRHVTDDPFPDKPNMTRVSLIYAKSGGGHISLAKATEEALNKYYPRKFQVSFFDPFPALYSLAYRKLGTDWQRLWRAGFKATDNPSFTRIMQQINSLPTTDNLAFHFTEFKPDIVIINNPLANLTLNRAMEKSGIYPKTVVHFADPFTLHHAWLVHQKIDLYFSPTAEATAIAIENGLPQQTIKTIGWLTREKFVNWPPPPKKARENLGFPSGKFIIFLGGAGQGAGRIYDFVETISENKQLLEKLFIIVNTGLNASLLSKITRLVEKIPDSFYIVPYAHNMPQLLWASDIVAGKAGPNFIFESIHALRPILAIGCLPGQEEANLEFIRSQNFGWVEEDMPRAVQLIENLITNPKLIAEKIPHLKHIKKQNLSAAKNLAREINHLI